MWQPVATVTPRHEATTMGTGRWPGASCVALLLPHLWSWRQRQARGSHQPP